MKLIIIRGNLKDGLSVIERAGSENTNLPILKNVLLEATDNKLKLTATNLEIAISYFVFGKIIENGKTTVPLRLLTDLIGNLQSERLNIDKHGSGIEVKTENYRATLQGLPAEDFPIIPHVTHEGNFMSIKGDLLKETLLQVVPSAQTNDLRPELSSVLVSFSTDALKVVATDSFRLSEKTIFKNQITTNQKREFQFLLPLKTAQELLRIIKDDEAVRIYHDENQVLFQTDRFEFVSRLLNGAFPDYAAILPKKFDTEIILERQELINAIKLAGVFSARVNEVKIKIADAKKNIEVFSSDQALGENKYLIPAKIQGEAHETSFNWRYLMDGLKAIRGDQVYFGINEENKPAILKSSSDTSYFYIVMPIFKT